MKIGTTYPSFNWDIRNSFRDALGTSVEVKLMNTMEDLEEADLVAFPGGEDVNPSIYSKNNTHSHGINKNRDEREKFFYKHARQLNKPMFGMCRGLQFLSAMLGLELIQDIYLELEKRHSGGHAIEKVVDSIVSKNFSYVNSLHHQGVFVDTSNIQLLRNYRDRGIYITSLYENVVESLESDRIIATQFHPEFMHSKESNAFFTDLGKWIEKPEFTFSMKDYDAKLMRTPANQVRMASLEEMLEAVPTMRSSYRFVTTSSSDTTSIGTDTGRISPAYATDWIGPEEPYMYPVEAVPEEEEPVYEEEEEEEEDE
jgi:putative glutamine amidotransferase